MNQETTLDSQSSCGGNCDGGGLAPAVQPDYRVQRRDQGVTLHLALPGVPKDQVQISLEQGLLRVTAQRVDSTPEDWKTHRAHGQGIRYELRMRLHRDLDPASVHANLVDGVLTLEIERHEAAKPRTIAVD